MSLTMSNLRMLLIAIVVTACCSCGNDKRTIISKKFLPLPCICGFSYARLGSGEGTYFEDSCHFYRIGNEAK